MLPARTLTCAAAARSSMRAARSSSRQQARFQSTATSSSSSAGTSPYVAGAVGGLIAGGTLYGAYLMTPSGKMARSINKGTKEAAQKYQQAAAKLQEATPTTDETVSYLKDLCYSYVGWFPGGRQYVDTAFNDLEKVRRNHKDEADEILSEALKQFKDVSKAGLSLEAARRGLEVLADVAKKVAALGTDAAGDILENHPQVKEKFGGSIDTLKTMGEQYGPEAKKQVDETWKQLSEVVAGGLSAENLNKARQLLQDKTEQVRKLGDTAWQKGLEEAKPYLDKSPAVKKLVQDNADALRQGNAKELFDRARKAVDSGDSGDLEGYVKKAVDTAKGKAKAKGNSTKQEEGEGEGGLTQYLDQMLPAGGSGDIVPKLLQLKEVADHHTDESEKLVRETMDELKKVLESKSERAKKILNKAKQEAK